jgi:cytochrome b561
MPFSKKVIWGKSGLARKLNIAPKDRIEELKLRHKMLQTHQKLGLLTLGVMSSQYYLGNQMADAGNYENRNLHRTLGYSTFGLYMTAAGFSILSPPAMQYGNQNSSIKLHRYLSYIHFTGMLCMPYLGYLSAGNMDTDSAEYHTKALRAHEIVAAITFTSLSLSFLTTLLP